MSGSYGKGEASKVKALEAKANKTPGAFKRKKGKY